MASRRTTSAPELRSPGATIARAALAAVVGGLLAWQVIASGLSLAAIGRDQGAEALAASPGSARGAAMLAQSELAAGDATGAEMLARRALATTPIDARALRVLGFAREQRGDAAGSAAMLNQAAALGWRDGPTQVWLAEAARAAGDHDAAALHLDAAARDVGRSERSLALVDAMIADPAMRREMAKRMAAMPPWRGMYLLDPLPLPPQQLASRGLLMLDMAALGSPASPAEVASVTRRLVDAGDYAAAYRVFRASSAPGRAEPDEGFDRASSDPSAISPFDWRLGNIAGASATGAATATGRRVEVTSDGTAAGVVMRRIVLLAPGAHGLSATISADPAASATFRWTLACLPDRKLLPVIGPSSTGATLAGVRWSVPAQGCIAQEVALRALPGPGGHATAEIDGATLR